MEDDEIPRDHVFLPVPETPNRVLMDLATRCNLRCPMCIVWGVADETEADKVKGVMDLEGSLRLFDELKGAEVLIQPNLWGEPLLAPHIKKQLVEMKSRGLTVAMNSNGLRLTPELAKLLVDIKVDSIFFSVDATTNETLKKVRGVNKLEKIEAAVHRLIEARGEAELPRIGVSFTCQPENEAELDAFVRRWTQVVDCVRVGLLYEDGTFPHLQVPKKRTPCPAIYRTLAVHNDGQVTVCCLDALRTTDMGNVFKDGIKGVWHGEALRKVRYYHETEQWDKVPFCKNCNGWAQYHFEEEVRDGLLIRRSPEYTYYNRIDRMKNWNGALLGGHKPSSITDRTNAGDRGAGGRVRAAPASENPGE